MIQSVRCHKFWNDLRKADPVLLECMSFKYKSWSKVPLVNHVAYEYPIGEFPKIAARRMVRNNPELFRLAIPLKSSKIPIKRAKKIHDG